MHLSSGSQYNAPESRASITAIDENFEGISSLMDRACEGGETCALASANGHAPVVPLKRVFYGMSGKRVETIEND